MLKAAFATAVLLMSTLLAATGAQAQLAGQWTLELGAWQASEGREVRIPGGNTGTLDVRIRGDSAFAQLQDGAPEPQELRGRVQGNTAKLVGTREARRNLNGTVTEIVLSVELDITVANQQATGTITLKNAGEEPVFRTFKGRAAPREE